MDRQEARYEAARQRVAAARLTHSQAVCELADAIKELEVATGAFVTRCRIAESIVQHRTTQQSSQLSLQAPLQSGS